MFAEVPNAFVTSIAVNGDDVYVAGNINVNNNGTVLTAADYVAKWDGANWSALGSNGSGNGSLNNGIYSLAQSNNKLYVGGVFKNVNNNGTVLPNADYVAAYAIGDGIVRVALDGTSTPVCGKDWSAPCDLQYALTSLASPGDEIWVAAGTYKPTATTDRTISFTLKNGVAIYGGFAGTETLRTQRNPSTNVTILSGEIGAAGTADNSYHVVVGGGTNNTAVLDGFTITAGNANGIFPNDSGGGMYNSSSSPSLANMAFSGNSAISGGGIYNNTSSPSLTNVVFNGNSADDGGGMGNYTSSPSLTNVSFIANFANTSGGGMSNYNASSPSILNVLFSGNSAGSVGGGMVNVLNSSPSLTNVTFYNNSAVESGGAIGYSGNSGGSPTLINGTLKANTAATGGGIYNGNSNLTIKNSILWGNTNGDLVNFNGSIPSVTYSIVQGGYVGTGNLNSDPLLDALANNGGFTQTMALGAGSPAIDAGTNTGCPATDQRGVTRPQGSQCDIGAYEIGSVPQLALTYVPPYGTSVYPTTPIDVLTGQALNINLSNYHVVCYVYVPLSLPYGDNGWWIKPHDYVYNNNNTWETSINNDGTWGCDIATGVYDPYATIIEAYLVPNAGKLATPPTRAWLDLYGVAKVTATRTPIEVPPTVLTILRANSNPTSATTVNFTVTFSEAVTGVNTGDFALSKTGGITGELVTNVTGSGATRTVTVNTGSGNGSLRLDVVDDDSIKDVANNPLGGNGTGNGDFTSGEVYAVTKDPTFSDVPSSHPYYSDIEILYANGYTGGCATSPSLLFCPELVMNRAQAAVFMMRGNFGGAYLPPSVPTHFFKDNWANALWAETWAEAMFNNGLTGGCSTSPLLFCPYEQLTNAQAAVFGLRLKYGTLYTPPVASGNVFADMTDASFWATGWAEQAYADGLLPSCGTSGGKPLFCPNALVNRGFGASIIVKAKNLTMP